MCFEALRRWTVSVGIITDLCSRHGGSYLANWPRHRIAAQVECRHRYQATFDDKDEKDKEVLAGAATMRNREKGGWEVDGEDKHRAASASATFSSKHKNFCLELSKKINRVRVNMTLTLGILGYTEHKNMTKYLTFWLGSTSRLLDELCREG